MCTSRQLFDPLRHFSRVPSRRVLQCCGFSADHNVFEFFTERVAALSHVGPHLRGLSLARKCVPNEDQLVRTQNNKLAVRHEDLGRLVGVDGGEKGIDGVGDGGDVLLTLFLVEKQELAVAVAQFGGRSGAVVRCLVGQRVVR